MNLKSWYLKVTVAGIVIRLILSAITLHPDFWAFSLAGRIFAHDGIFNIYDFLHNLKASSPYLLYGKDFFTYPPLAYFTTGIFHFILQPLIGNDFYQQLFVNFSHAAQTPGIFQHLILVKLPYLFFDIAVAFLLTNLFESEKQKRAALLLWIFNPVSWYSSFTIGQIDIIATFFIVLPLVFIKKNKNDLALLSLGFGGAYKIFPLLLVPVAALLLNKNIFQRIKLFIIGLAPFIITILPFLGSATFKALVLFGTNSQKLLYAGINVSGADTIYLFIIAYFLLLIFAYFRNERENIWKYFFLVFLLFFAVTNFHPQWFLWITPFLILFMVEYPVYKPVVFGLLLFFFLIVLTFESSLSYGLFEPIIHSVHGGKPLLQFLPTAIQPSVVRSLIRSIFASFNLALILIILNQFRLKSTDDAKS